MSRYRSTFSTPEQAVAEALVLGLMAPGESEAQEPTDSPAECGLVLYPLFAAALFEPIPLS